MNQFCTYLHCRPDGTPFYVGKGLLRRAKELHHGRNKYHQNIVAKYGVTNIIVQITANNLTEEEAHSRECFLIDHFRRLGYQLTNMTDGGEGASGHKHSAESIAKMSAALKGNKHCVGRILSPKHRAIIGALNRGKTLSLEQRVKISARRKGKATTLGFRHTEETITKMRAAKIGRKFSAEHCAKLSLALKGKKNGLGYKHSPEAIAKIRISSMDRRHSAATRIKMSVSRQLYWDKKLGRIQQQWIQSTLI